MCYVEFYVNDDFDERCWKIIQLIDSGTVFINDKPNLRYVHAMQPAIAVFSESEYVATFAFGKPDVSLINDHEIMVVFWATKSCITHIRWARIELG